MPRSSAILTRSICASCGRRWRRARRAAGVRPGGRTPIGTTAIGPVEWWTAAETSPYRCPSHTTRHLRVLADVGDGLARIRSSDPVPRAADPLPAGIIGLRYLRLIDPA